MCNLLNVGCGDMQVRSKGHTKRSMRTKEQFKVAERRLDEDGKLFEESTFEGSRAAAQKMKKYAKGQETYKRGLLMFHSLDVLVRSSNSEMLSWPNSPLLVLLQFVDLLDGDEEMIVIPLHQLAGLADPFEFSSHQNQLILAKQLIDHGANVKAVSNPLGLTPLHMACFWAIVTSLDLVELLLEKGADPNTKDHHR